MVTHYGIIRPKQNERKQKKEFYLHHYAAPQNALEKELTFLFLAVLTVAEVGSIYNSTGGSRIYLRETK